MQRGIEALAQRMAWIVADADQRLLDGRDNLAIDLFVDG
jgi:hypothetical protein